MAQENKRTDERKEDRNSDRNRNNSDGKMRTDDEQSSSGKNSHPDSERKDSSNDGQRGNQDRFDKGKSGNPTQGISSTQEEDSESEKKGDYKMNTNRKEVQQEH